jgi:hypothetical protein
MTRSGFALGRQLATVAVVAALALSLAGDRTSAAGVPAPVYGQDPLEVLELKVRPNVIVVMDSSGSMLNNVTETSNTRSEDHPRSKLFQGKAVLQKIVQDNQDKVSFMYGTYTGNGVRLDNQGAGVARFQYTTSTMPSPELTVRRALGDSGERGLQSWQIIDPLWDTLYFDEDNNGSGTTPDARCGPRLTSGTARFFATGSDLAKALEDGMNLTPNCSTGSRSNTYRVSYDTSNGRFGFRCSTCNRYWRIAWDRPNNIRNALAESTSTSPTSYTNSSSTTRYTDAPWTLLYRTTGTGTAGSMASPFGDGLNVQWKFTETIAGTPTTFYQVATSRVWNGETVRVDSNGAVCGMTFASAKTNPPRLTVQRADASCNPTGASAVFEFAGGSTSYNDDNCFGFRMKSALVPCDLQSPPAGTQFELTNAYLDRGLPFNAADGTDRYGNPYYVGEPRDYTTNDASGAWGGTNYGKPDGKPDYLEKMDGSWAVDFIALAPTTKPGSYTPVANSLIDIKGLPDGSNRCLSNPDPPAGTHDSLVPNPTSGQCVERGFSKLWNYGQDGSTAMDGDWPWKLDPIKNHKDPKEKTIVLFVTDGDDTCGSRGNNSNSSNMDSNALRAAYHAERLYTPLDTAEPASSVQTYVIGYGGGFTGDRLNWVAWGGSGLGQGQTGQPDVGTTGTSCESAPATRPVTGSGATGTCRWSPDSTTLKNLRAKCTTCVDAYIAPDAATLAAQLQSIIDQGASDGDFNAQQSITESVFEYVYRVPGKDASKPTLRYDAIVPTRFVSSFTLPGFKGQLKAYQNDGTGNSVLMWSAGDKLSTQIADAMAPAFCNVAGYNLERGCVMADLHGGATDANIGTSSARIKRRIYTTSRNGVFFNGAAPSPTDLMAGVSTQRVSLWPPAPGVLQNSYTSLGTFDAAMGLPSNSPGFPTNVPPGFCNSKTAKKCWADLLARDYNACVGSNRSTECQSTNEDTKLQAARREARDVIIAFLAGAAPVLAEQGGIARAASGSSKNTILFKARPWVLGDSEMATVSVVTPPSLSLPEATPYESEYRYYRDGAGAKPRPDSDVMIRKGFGLAQPDNDNTTAGSAPDTRTKLKPVMTVVYAPANDMLHAFRAGPCDTPSLDAPSCTETGGEELWGFVPYDQLEAVRLRAAYEPQGRDNHVYMIARGVRFADVFVPGAVQADIGGETVDLGGVWRRVIYFGRGIGGKYLTALDVTGPGPYTARALGTTPPIPLWSRGNPDTEYGPLGGNPNHTTDDKNDYAHMGETWSMPTVAYVNENRTNPAYDTARRSGVDFVLFVGSGYGDPNAAVREGTTHYALDALSGDVIAAVDVEDVAASFGLTRPICAKDAEGNPVETPTCSVMPNAIVANSVSFNRSAFTSVSAKAFNVNPHPWSFISTRVYVSDLHGRLWKILTEYPGTVLPAADLGANQPVATAVALQGEDVDPSKPDPATMIPNIFVTSGADSRASGPFRNFSLIDEGTDKDATAPSSTELKDGVTSYLPVKVQFADDFIPGDSLGCAYTEEAVFRGTIQPTSAVECSAPLQGSKCNGDLLQRVFYGGTRLSLPNTKFAPPTPLGCSCTADANINSCDPNEKLCCGYPCRSQFDSILYALGVETGDAAYELNSSGDQAYRIFRDSRIAALSIQADPDPGKGGSRLVADEGLMKTTPPAPPPPPGIPPTATTATANVVFKRVPGQPAPAVQYGSTVCQ